MTEPSVLEYKERWLTDKKLTKITNVHKYINVKFKEACKKGLVNICKMLLEEYEIEIDTLNHCLAHQNIYNNRNLLNMTKLLLEAGADPDTISYSGGKHRTLLINSVWRNDVINLLIEAGANPFIMDDKGKMAIDYCGRDRERQQLLQNYMNEWLMDEFGDVGNRGQYLPEDLLSKIGKYL